MGATHVIDRQIALSSLPDEILEITKHPIETVYDAVSLPETQQAGYDILADGGHLILVLTSELKSLTDIKHIINVFGVLTLPETREFGVQLYAHLGALLEEGVIQVSQLLVVSVTILTRCTTA